MRKQMLKFLPLCLMAALLSYGCVQTGGTEDAAKAPAKKAEQAQKKNVYKGKVTGKSNKAKSISIVVGKGDKAKTMMVKFDDKTTGVDHAAVGHASIIAYEMRDDQPWATVIKPKLAKLPKGTTEIKTAEMAELIASDTKIMLIDARPAGRYKAAHMTGAVNIPVGVAKKNLAELLPKEKDTLLVTYCGGPT